MDGDNDDAMRPSEKVEAVTRTFSADQKFCDYLLRSDAARLVGRMLLYHRWAWKYMVHCQTGLWDNVAARFEETDREQAQVWTSIMLGSVFRGIGLVQYLSLRGLVGEAEVVIRRALESMGVVSHFWHEPQKVRAVGDPDSSAFKATFQRESREDKAKVLKAKGLSKRFEYLKLGEPASSLYALMSRSSVHGDSAHHLGNTSLVPTPFSCGFENRSVERLVSKFDILAKGCEILCVETAILCGLYAVRSREVREAGAVITVWLSSPEEMERRIDGVLSEVS